MLSVFYKSIAKLFLESVIFSVKCHRGLKDKVMPHDLEEQVKIMFINKKY